MSLLKGDNTQLLLQHRTHLTQNNIDTCLQHATQCFPNHILEDMAQGGCSYTVKATSLNDGTAVVVQFRVSRYALPLEIATAAHELFPGLAPETQQLGRVGIGDAVDVQVLAMSSILGQRFSDLQPHRATLDDQEVAKMRTLLQSLGAFFTLQWKTGMHYCPTLSGCKGKVGSTLLLRLKTLESQLPSRALRQKAAAVREQVQAGLLNLLPVVLSHGDLIPSNIMVDTQTWRVEGYVDWAESEHLPFGICLYALEHLLGFLEEDPASQRPGKAASVYYEQAEELRSWFWMSLEGEVPELRSETVRCAVRVAGEVGVLLWHGFAWDDGKIDRVVDIQHDAVEVVKLRSFLRIMGEDSRRDSKIEEC